MPFDRSARGLGPRVARVWIVWCGMGASVALASCGGRAADGVEPEANGDGVDESTPGEPDSDDEPERVRPRRETCADNPLLAGCPSASAAAVPPPVEVELEAPSVPFAQNVLASHCGACHGPALTPAQASAGINYIDDWDRLMETGWIQECSPGSSPIVQIMRSGAMPPARSGLAPVPDRDVEVVVEAIELDCTDE